MTADQSSITHLYRRLLAFRRSSSALQLGDLRLVDAPAGVLAYERASMENGDSLTVFVNFSSETVRVDATGRIEVSSVGRDGEPFDAELQPDEAVVVSS
jgi:glycosidase